MNRRGFSLVEMMIASAIVMGICLALIAVIRMNHRSWQTRENSMTISFELRRGVDAMTRELSQTQQQWLELAGGGAFPADGVVRSSIQFRMPQDNDGDGTVLDAAGATEWSAPIVYSLGGLDGRQIVRAQGGNNRVLAHGVTALSFRRAAAFPSMVEMGLTVERGNASGGFLQQVNHGTRIRVRN